LNIKKKKERQKREAGQAKTAALKRRPKRYCKKKKSQKEKTLGSIQKLEIGIWKRQTSKNSDFFNFWYKNIYVDKKGKHRKFPDFWEKLELECTGTQRTKTIFDFLFKNINLRPPLQKISIKICRKKFMFGK
jgi:hypothetical protein